MMEIRRYRGGPVSTGEDHPAPHESGPGFVNRGQYQRPSSGPLRNTATYGIDAYGYNPGPGGEQVVSVGK